MNPHLLRTFLSVRKHRNYTRAAEEVLLSQPAVSRRVRQLEEELGVRLFEQIGKSLHTTDAGETLAAEAEKLLGAMERTAEAVRSHGSEECGSIRIGASATPGFYLLPGILGRFHRRFPKVALHYTVENSLRIEQKIVRNELDLGFVGAHLANEELELTTLLEDEIVCFTSPSHPLAKVRRVAPDSLGDEVWITREKGSATRQLFEDWLSSRRGAIRKSIELTCPETCKALVKEGIGLSFMSIYGLRSEIRSKRLVRVPVTGMTLKRPIFLARHSDKRNSPAMESFLAIVKTALPELTMS
ncbi:MAG: LysR family transcriptional regulator [Deltaproteobacteria bacterium]|nr:LysR family transcriptional regulator [Deltaproteobacteria bacterium]